MPIEGLSRAFPRPADIGAVREVVMWSDRFSSGQALRSWIFWFEIAAAAVALPPAVLFVWPIVRFSGEQIVFLIEVVAALFAVGGLIWIVASRARSAPLARYIDESRDGQPAPETCRAAFQTVMDLPRFTFLVGYVIWCSGGFIAAFCARLRFDDFSALAFLCTFAAGFAGGLVSQIFSYLWLRRRLESLRARIAADVGEADVRAGLVRRNPIAKKLMFSVTALLLMNLFFGMGIAHVRATDRAEAVVGEWRTGVLEGVIRIAASGGPGEELLADAEAILAASSPDAVSSTGVFDILGDYGLLIVSSAFIGILITFYGARDISRAANVLGREVERVASGDLTPGRVFESEDEFGDLARSFERMASSLRTAVGHVTETADRVEGAAEKITVASRDVDAVTREQVAGLSRAAGSMEEIHGQMREIAESSEDLTASMDASSSSLGLITSGGQGLHEKAAILSTRVSDVSASIDQTMTSVEDVSRRADAVADKATSVAASMDRMQESMKGVTESAVESAQLAKQVVETADRGQERVQRTIAGMEAIRRATEAAQGVIRSLGTRTEQIGTILDVINDVAGETNLLALNASIIAAQAGEQGRAFGVVAAEVETLADRVLASTKEIGEVISAVQDESARAVEAIESGAGSVREGVGLSAEAGVSLEEITRTARESGDRISEIVAVIHGQSRATSAVVELMQQVREGVEEIQALGSGQAKDAEVVCSSSVAMEQIADGVRTTAEQQAQSVNQVRDGIERVVKTSAAIAASLQAQREASASAARLLADVFGSTRSNEESTEAMDDAIRGLVRQAEALREDLHRFKT